MSHAHHEWLQAPLPAIVVPDALAPTTWHALRAEIRSTQLERCTLLTRGSYEHGQWLPSATWVTNLTERAMDLSGQGLRLHSASIVRLCPGDYVYSAADRVHDDRPFEMIVDLSDAPVPGASVHYRHRGQHFFSFDSAPMALCLVQRGPTVLCNHTYVSLRHRDASVLRLVVTLGLLA